MPLDPHLGARYKALFHNYGTGRGFFAMPALKSAISDKERRLRDDAAYFVLVNLDHMVIQALSLYIPEPSTSTNGTTMRPHVANPSEAYRMALDALNIIQEGLKEEPDPGDEGYSANAVIRSISRKSEKIGEAILWWKE